VVVLTAALLIPAAVYGGSVEVCDCDYAGSVAVGATSAAGSVTNTTDREVCYLRVEIFFENAEGKVLSSKTVYCSPHILAPGKSADFTFDIPEDINIDHHHTRLDVRYRYQ